MQGFSELPGGELPKCLDIMQAPGYLPHPLRMPCTCQLALYFLESAPSSALLSHGQVIILVFLLITIITITTVIITSIIIISINISIIISSLSTPSHHHLHHHHLHHHHHHHCGCHCEKPRGEGKAEIPQNTSPYKRGGQAELKLEKGGQTMKTPEYQTKEFSFYPETVRALEEFSAGECTGLFVFRQIPPEGRGSEEGPWRGQISHHQSGA